MVSINMAACKSTVPAIVSDSGVEAPLLLFQKTPCYGTCPAYEALVYTSGEVRFVPWEHTPVTDTLTFRLTANELKALNASIADLNYKTLQDLYKTDWTDMPATHLYFYEAGKEVKHIKHQQGGPEKLVKFNETVHQLIWKYVTAKAK